MTTPDCPACERHVSKPVGKKDGFELRRCVDCRSLFVDPLPTSSGAAERYAGDYSQIEPVPAVVLESLNRLVMGAEPWRSTRRWLDVGFGDGSLLEVVSARGWVVHGTEVARPALDRAAGRGWAVADNLSAGVFPPEGFDVITMVELLEHVPSAVPFLHAAWGLLRRGGLLYVSTPNARSLNARLLEMSWSVVSPPDHLVLFSPPGLERRLTASGFILRRTRCEGLNPAELTTLLGRSGAQSATYHRQHAAVALAESLSRSPLRRSFKRAANAALSAARLGDTLKMWAIRP